MQALNIRATMSCSTNCSGSCSGTSLNLRRVDVVQYLHHPRKVIYESTGGGPQGRTVCRRGIAVYPEHDHRAANSIVLKRSTERRTFADSRYPDWRIRIGSSAVPSREQMRPPNRRLRTPKSGHPRGRDPAERRSSLLASDWVSYDFFGHPSCSVRISI